MVLDLARSYPIQDLTRSMLMLALKAARLNWSLQSTLCHYVSSLVLHCYVHCSISISVPCEKEGPVVESL